MPDRGTKRRERERERATRRLLEIARWLDNYKTSMGCADCGFDRWPEALQFDHIDRATKRRDLGWFDNRSKLKSRAKADQFKAHVKRYCVVRCANCHAHRSAAEEHWRPVTQASIDRGLTLF